MREPGVEKRLRARARRRDLVADAGDRGPERVGGLRAFALRRLRGADRREKLPAFQRGVLRPAAQRARDDDRVDKRRRRRRPDLERRKSGKAGGPGGAEEQQFFHGSLPLQFCSAALPPPGERLTAAQSAADTTSFHYRKHA